MRKPMIVALLASGALFAAAPAQAQNVQVNPDASVQVGFPGANCSVHYDQYGRRTAARPGCNAGHLQRADDLVGQRFGRPGGGPGYDPIGRPSVSIDRDGRGRVEFYERRCTVRYDRRGERDGADRQCSREQIGRADVAMNAYRREQGYDRPDWGTIPPWNGPQQPRLWISPRDGHGSVYFDRGCTVRYDRYGRREGADRGCSRRQIDWADEAMRIYRRQQGVR